MGAPTLNSQVTAQPSGSTSFTMTIPTVSAGDYIYVCYGGIGSFPAITSVTGGGITFTSRAANTYSSGCVSVFRGQASSSATNLILTVTLNVTAPTNSIAWASSWSGVTGFDGNAHWPYLTGSASAPVNTAVPGSSANVTMMAFYYSGSNSVSAWQANEGVTLDFAIGNTSPLKYAIGGHVSIGQLFSSGGFTLDSNAAAGGVLFADVMVGSTPSPSPPTLGATVKTGTATNSSTISSAALATSGAARLYAVIGCDGAANVASITSTSGLTWHKRVNKQTGLGSTSTCNIDFWYADAPSALSGEVVTATMSNSTYDDGAIFVFTATGVAPVGFDANASLPAYGYSSTSNTGANVSYSTNGAGAIAIAINCSQASLGTSGGAYPPLGWFSLGNVLNSGGSKYCTVDVLYNVIQGPVASAAAQFNETFSSPNVLATVIDVITSATPATGGTPMAIFM